MSLETAPGFGVALRAAQAAAQTPPGDVDLDVAAGTFVLWCAAVDTQMVETHGKVYEKLRNDDSAGKIFPGLVLARHAIAHGLRIVIAPGGLSWPESWPESWPPPTWSPLPELLEVWPEGHPPTKHQQDSYFRWMSGKPVSPVMVTALQWLVKLEGPCRI